MIDNSVYLVAVSKDTKYLLKNCLKLKPKERFDCHQIIKHLNKTVRRMSLEYAINFKSIAQNINNYASIPLFVK